jgi:hypothetical protein
MSSHLNTHQREALRRARQTGDVRTINRLTRRAARHPRDAR